MTNKKVYINIVGVLLDLRVRLPYFITYEDKDHHSPAGFTNMYLSK